MVFCDIFKVHVVLLFEDFFEVWQCQAWNFLQIGLQVFAMNMVMEFQRIRITFQD